MDLQGFSRVAEPSPSVTHATTPRLRPVRAISTFNARCPYKSIKRQQHVQSFATGSSAETQAVPISELRELVHASLLGLKYSEDEAQIIGDVSAALSSQSFMHVYMLLA